MSPAQRNPKQYTDAEYNVVLRQSLLVSAGYKLEWLFLFFGFFFQSLTIKSLFRDFVFFFQQDIIIWKHLHCDLRRPPIGFPPTQKSIQQEKPIANPNHYRVIDPLKLQLQSFFFLEQIFERVFDIK